MSSTLKRIPSSSPNQPEKDQAIIEDPTILSTLVLPQNGETVPILGEIIGCTNLMHPLNLDCKKLQPFVIVKLKVDDSIEVLRRTKRLKNFCNPVWCVKDRCFFLIHVSKLMLNNSAANGKSVSILLEVRHKDSSKPSSCTLIGSTFIKLNEILGRRAEERIEVSLESNLSRKYAGFRGNKTDYPDDHEDDPFIFSIGWLNDDDIKSKIALRFRPATTLDLKFMKKFGAMVKNGNFSFFLRNERKRKEITLEGDSFGTHTFTQSGRNLITEKSQQSVGLSGVVNKLNYSFRKKYTDSLGVERNRVKPYPDPLRKSETMYLSSAEMRNAMLSPSTKWLRTGETTSPSLGILHLEVLSCNNLPNMDAGEVIGNYTDAFICAAFEDSLVQTDVIDDELSPIWMPWSQREFSFRIRHASSPLYVSAMDFDLGLGGHEGIGRVAINLNHFEADVVYTLQYALYSSANTWDREPLGTVTIRLRKEITDSKALLMSSLNPPPRFHVNMQSKKTLSVANFTCCGNHNEDLYDVKLLRSYIDEIFELKLFLSYSIADAFNSLIMWQGQVKIGSRYLPMHSVCAFFGGIYLVERPHLIPGFFFLGIAWLMIISMHSCSHHPSPWRRLPTFTTHLSTLIYGDSVPSVTEIKVEDGHIENTKFEESWQNRLQTDLDASTKIWEMQQAVDEFGNLEIHTVEKKLTLDPLENVLESLAPKLFPIQKKLRWYCEILRQIRAVATWEQNLLSFWLNLSCLVIGATLILLPTVLLFQIICRIIVWVCFGPWIRIYYELNSYEHAHPVSSLHSKEGKDKHTRGIFEKVAQRFKKQARVARLNGEESLKMQAMRILRFGNHIAKIPSINFARYYDYPLTGGSSALHTSLLPSKTRKITTTFEASQRLDGLMIPVSEEEKQRTQSASDAQKSSDFEAMSEESEHDNNSAAEQSSTSSIQSDSTFRPNFIRDDSEMIDVPCFSDEFFDRMLSQLGFDNMTIPFNTLISSSIGDQDIDHSTYSSFITTSVANHLGIQNRKSCCAKDDVDCSTVSKEEGVEMVALMDKSGISSVLSNARVIQLENSQDSQYGVEMVALKDKSGISSACVMQIKSSEESQSTAIRGVKLIDERDGESVCIIQLKKSEDSQSVASGVEIVALEDKSSISNVTSSACVMQLKSSEESQSAASIEVTLVDEIDGESACVIKAKKAEDSQNVASREVEIIEERSSKKETSFSVIMDGLVIEEKRDFDDGNENGSLLDIMNASEGVYLDCSYLSKKSEDWQSAASGEEQLVEERDYEDDMNFSIKIDESFIEEERDVDDGIEDSSLLDIMKASESEGVYLDYDYI